MNKFVTAAALMAALIIAPVFINALAHAQNHEVDATHACPMNRKIQGVEGDVCPKCGMELVAIDQGVHNHEHNNHDHQNHEHSSYDHQGYEHPSHQHGNHHHQGHDH